MFRYTGTCAICGKRLAAEASRLPNGSHGIVVKCPRCGESNRLSSTEQEIVKVDVAPLAHVRRVTSITQFRIPQFVRRHKGLGIGAGVVGVFFAWVGFHVSTVEYKCQLYDIEAFRMLYRAYREEGVSHRDAARLGRSTCDGNLFEEDCHDCQLALVNEVYLDDEFIPTGVTIDDAYSLLMWHRIAKRIHNRYQWMGSLSGYRQRIMTVYEYLTSLGYDSDEVIAVIVDRFQQHGHGEEIWRERMSQAGASRQRNR